MNKIKAFLLLLFLINLPLLASGAGDLNQKKMQEATSQILTIFVNGNSDDLNGYISEEWLDKNKVNMKKHKVNNYSPKQFEVLFANGDICTAMIWGDGWRHLLVFKFTDERGKYRVIPKGLYEKGSEYIDPWWYVKDYINEIPTTDPPKEEDK